MNEDRINLAKALAEELVSADVCSVLLIGSSARGIALADSDLDLAVIVDKPPKLTMHGERRGELEVGIEFFFRGDLASWARSRKLDRLQLRTVGRFTNCKVLFNRWSELERVLEGLRDAVLDPVEARRLLRTVTGGIHDAGPGTEATTLQRVWTLQAVAIAAAMLQLQLTEFRFQKAKWVIADLIRSGSWELIEAIRLLFPPRELGLQVVKHNLAVIEQGLRRAFKHLGVEFAITRPNVGFSWTFHTFQDATSLFRVGDWKGAGYTGMNAVRMMHRLLCNEGRAPADADFGTVEQWRKDVLDAVMHLDDTAAQDALLAHAKLVAIADDLVRKYDSVCASRRRSRP